MNYYELLEVSQSASPEVIRAAYKSLMQRYHPDRNPGNAGVAAHAQAVILAYEVLSDAGKRSAYDLSLKQRFADGTAPVRSGPVRTAVAGDSKVDDERRSYGILWMLIVLTIGLSLFAMWLLLKDRPGARLSSPSESEIREGLSARTIPEFVSDMNVTLKGSDVFGSPVRVLNIPVMGIRIGAYDADKVLHAIDKNREDIHQRLEERLSDARYEELIRPEGEQYLKDMVIGTIGDAIGTTMYRSDLIHSAVAASGYGVVDVLLPKSYSVH